MQNESLLLFEKVSQLVILKDTVGFLPRILQDWTTFLAVKIRDDDEKLSSLILFL